MDKKRLLINKWILSFFLFFLTFFLLFSPFSLTLIGKLLIKSDPLSKADIIIVLAGEQGERVQYGVELYKQGYADKILFSGGSIVDFPGGEKITWAGLMKDYATLLGVPENAIILQDESRSTQEDALFSSRLLQDQNFYSVILVTSPYHSRRAYLMFKQVFKGIEIHSAPVVNSWYDANSWWKNFKGRYQVAREYFAYLWYFLEDLS
ncbi:MAG: YdcF family protein [Nitrospinota bacterium]